MTADAKAILIDSGNSRIKLGAIAHKNRNVDHKSSPPVPPELDTATFDNGDVEGIRKWVKYQTADAVHNGTATSRHAITAYGVNVAGSIQQNILDVLLADVGCRISWLGAQARSGRLANAYVIPTRLGADRWAALVGVMTRMTAIHPPFILASFGTATTIDIVGPDDVFHGGVILPGPRMMAQSLATGTANLPLAHVPSVAFPIDTDAAIATGIAAAQAGALARQLLLAYAHFAQMPAIYVAGGGWPEVASETRRMLDDVAQSKNVSAIEIITLNQPVLEGLAYMAQINTTVVNL